MKLSTEAVSPIEEKIEDLMMIDSDDMPPNEEEQHEGAPKIKIKFRPALPNQEEVDKHFAANHVPFRLWCSHCVKGRADGNQHRRTTNQRKLRR